MSPHTNTMPLHILMLICQHTYCKVEFCHKTECDFYSLQNTYLKFSSGTAAFMFSTETKIGFQTAVYTSHLYYNNNGLGLDKCLSR